MTAPKETEVPAEPEEATSAAGGKTSDWSPTPIEVTHPDRVDPKDIRLLYDPPWRLRLTIEGDRSYLTAKVVRAAPLSNPDGFICFLDSRDEVFCMVEDLKDLAPELREIIRKELDRRYMTAIVQQVRALRSEYGVSYWDVQTDRGTREFVVKDVSENAQWLTEDRVMLLDVDNNRFEIQSLDRLDRKSRSLIELVL